MRISHRSFHLRNSIIADGRRIRRIRRNSWGEIGVKDRWAILLVFDGGIRGERRNEQRP